MEKPKEFEELSIEYYVDQYTGLFGSECSLDQKAALLLGNKVLSICEQIKKDAWNAAIRWAAENCKCKYDSVESHVSGEYCWDVNVNKQSILNGLID